MRTYGLGWMVLLTVACGPKIAVDEDTGGGTETGNTDASGPTSASTTPPNTTSQPPPSTTTTTTGPDPDDTATVTTAEPTDGDPMPGVSCNEDAECASGHCYILGVLGGICGECTSDADCPDGGCTPPNPLGDPPEPSVCNTGMLGDGCESDAVCEGMLLCATVLDIPGVITSNTCSQCRGDFDCAFGQLCNPMIDILALSGVNLCVDPGTQPVGASCDHFGSGDLACTSGHCAIADVMGLLQVGVCSQCETDTDCPPNTQCHPPEVDLAQGYIPGYCE